MRVPLLLAAVSGFLAVAIGAWSAHGAAHVLDPQALAWLHTGVEYQAMHSLALLAVAILMTLRPGRFLAAAAAAFTLGIVLFSGSLYALAATGLRAAGYLTPVGGVALLAGWALLAAYAVALRTRA